MIWRGEELVAVVALFAHLQEQAPPYLQSVRSVGSTASVVSRSTLSSTSKKLRSVSMRTRSTPVMISLMTFWRGSVGPILQALQVW